MSQKWIKQGDTVKIIAGNDKDQVGKVMARSKDRIAVQGVNVRKKHMPKRGQQGGGEIISIEKPVHISNVALCDADGNKIRLKRKGNELVYEKDGKETTYRTLRK